MEPARKPSLLERYRARRYAVLFYMLLATLALHPILELVLPRVDPMELLLAMSLMAAVAGVELDRRARPLVWLSIAFFLVRLASSFVEDTRVFSLSQFLWATACMFAAVLTIQHAFRRGVMDSERIFASLDAYLLAALAFGVTYWVLEREVPGSFGPAPLDLTPQVAVYISLATISTLGAADINPQNGPARGLVTFEAVAGQLYLTVLVARLVGMYATRDPSDA